MAEFCIDNDVDFSDPHSFADWIDDQDREEGEEVGEEEYERSIPPRDPFSAVNAIAARIAKDRERSAFILNESELDHLARQHNWAKEQGDPKTQMISFRRDDCRLNFWLSTGTVGSYLDHPKQGKTQLFRREVNMKDSSDIFLNPRKHTSIGYHTCDQIPAVVGQKRARQDETECTGCHEYKASSQFSRNQRSKGGAKVRCKSCVTGNIPIQSNQKVGKVGDGERDSGPVRVPGGPLNFLVVTEAEYEVGDCFWLPAILPLLREREFAHKVIDICTPGSIVKELAKNEHNVCIILNIETGQYDKTVTEDAQVQEYLQRWMKERGGKLFVHGGPTMISSWMPEKGWKYKDYRRVPHALAPNALWSGANSTTPDLPLTYSVKSALLINVGVEDRVYAAIGDTDRMIEEGLTTMLYTSFGLGRLGFIGDVNAEVHTIKTILALAEI